MNILTFDIEEWFHILAYEPTKLPSSWSNYEYRLDINIDRIFKLLDRNNLKATFFVLGWIAEKYPHIVKRIDSFGYEIGSHSSLHQLVYKQKPGEFKTDLEKSIKILEDITGKKIIIFRAPGFSITENTKWAFNELINCGIEIDCSIFPAKRGHGGFQYFGTAEPAIININGRFIKEFPINTINNFGHKFIFSGGGYFRFFPYRYIKRKMNISNYVMSYFHPRDFDYEQPILDNLSLIRHIKTYYGLKGSLNKLEKLVNDFKFVDIKTADSLTDWKATKVLDFTI